VLTQSELEALLAGPTTADGGALEQSDGNLAIQPDARIVMIQCVGSRDDEHPYCSRICCTQALKNAITLKSQLPDARIAILYRDIRSYGFRELLYRQARQAGVVFLEYSDEDRPQVSATDDNRLQARVVVQPEGEMVTLPADWVVLSTGIEPEPDNAALAQLLKVPLNETGFFLEAHVKLRPVDFAAEGIFLAGLAHSPRSIDETMAQASAAAVRAVALLSRPQLEATPIVASVNPKLCAACGICVRTHTAPKLAAWHADRVSPGCGACVAGVMPATKGFEFSRSLVC
jgi:heterodisulfide reductase subunit A-like polyferredoxin